jgi:hypothetical protein
MGRKGYQRLDLNSLTIISYVMKSLALLIGGRVFSLVDVAMALKFGSVNCPGQGCENIFVTFLNLATL